MQGEKRVTNLPLRAKMLGTGDLGEDLVHVSLHADTNRSEVGVVGIPGAQQFGVPHGGILRREHVVQILLIRVVQVAGRDGSTA